jgi:glycosyltransferase involved in cell wall biosynthesis
MMSRISLIIPALDEEEGLALVLAALPRNKLDRVVVVDNGSRDRTVAVARAGGAQVVQAPRRGYGSACLAGLASLAAAPPDIVVFLDADFSDDPADLAALLAPLEADQADLMVGSRKPGRMERGAMPWHARWGNRLATGLITLAHGKAFTDLGPFRAITWIALEQLAMRDPGFGWNVEMQVKALRLGLRCGEVPVAYRRRVGVSKISGTIAGSVRAGASILFSIARYGRGRVAVRHSGTK